LIVTPASFEPLLEPVEQSEPRTFAFRGNELLIREPDAALPGVSALSVLAIAPENVFLVGLLKPTAAPPGCPRMRLRPTAAGECARAHR
jgi:hypothetical protein